MREPSKTLWEALKKKYGANKKSKTPKLVYNPKTGRLEEKERKKPTYIEDKIQEDCIKWMKANLQEFIDQKLFFHVPNGGHRDGATADKMQKMGVVAGVADLFLEVPSQGYHGLKIELKAPKGRQSPHQKIYQKAVEEQGYKYIICRSVDEFANEITEYLRAEV